MQLLVPCPTMDVPQLLAQHLVAHSPLPTALCATGVFLLLVPKLRRIVFDVLETVIATFLLLVLIIVVLGLPFGEQKQHTGKVLIMYT